MWLVATALHSTGPGLCVTESSVGQQCAGPLAPMSTRLPRPFVVLYSEIFHASGVGESSETLNMLISKL